jgi:fatty acid desaturase
LSHGTPFKTKRLNEFFYKLFCFLTWNSHIHFRVSHMKHHQYTVHKGLDKEVILEPIALSGWDFLGWFTFNYKKFKMIMFTNLAHAFGRGDADFFFWDPPLFPAGNRHRAELCNWARFMFVGHLALVTLFICFRAWVLIYAVTFGCFFANFLAHGCGAQQHLGLRPGVPDWRVCCHTMKFNPVVGFLYWQMQYHIEHHMYAAVPFFNLPRLHKALAADMPVPPDGYLAGMRRILSIRKRQREDPSYCFTPEFPATAAPPRLASSGPPRVDS